jgi:hypothetical protein
MRVRLFLVGVSVSLLAVIGGIEACGGSEDSTPATTDSGPAETSTQDVAKDTSPVDTGADTATCDLSADFTKKIPDASLADGESSTGLCVGCAEAHCKSDIDKCNASCECKGLMDTALVCFAKNGASIQCAGPFINASKDTQNIGFGLAGCLQSSCPSECPAPNDGGITDAADGG